MVDHLNTDLDIEGSNTAAAQHPKNNREKKVFIRLISSSRVLKHSNAGRAIEVSNPTAWHQYNIAEKNVFIGPISCSMMVEHSTADLAIKVSSKGPALHLEKVVETGVFIQ